MRKDVKKTPKGGRTKKAVVKDLTVKAAKDVKGGTPGTDLSTTKTVDKGSASL